MSFFAPYSHHSRPLAAVRHWLMVCVVACVLGGVVVFASRLSVNVTAMVMIAVLAPFALLIVNDIQKAGLVVLLLDIPLQVDTFIGFDEAQADFSATIGYNFSLTTMALVLLYGYRALTHYERLLQGKSANAEVTSGHRSQKFLRLAYWLPLIYIGSTAFTYTVAQDPMRVTYELCLLIQIYLAVLYVLTYMRTRQDVLFICTLLVLGLCIAGAISAGLRVTGQGFSLGILNGRVDNDWQGLRVGGTVGTPNTAAGYFAFAMALAGGLLLAKVSRRLKTLAVCGLLFGSVGLVVTLSRGGWITFAIIIMVLLGMGVYRRFVKPWVILAVLALVAGVIFVFQGDITDRLLTADDRGSAESRLPLNEMAWRIIQDHPVLGIGLNNYDLAMQDYITPDLSGEWVYIVHNRYLLVWSETGIGSLAAYLALIFLGIAGSWQAIRLKDPMLSPIALGAFAGCCGILFHFAVDIFSGRNMLEMLWLMAGLQIVAWRVGVREPYDFQIEYADPPTRIRREIGQPLPNGANQGLDQEWGEWTSTT